jgi:ubiquinone/menaquinone biosynthesis C-methylase UbiE
MVASQEYYDEYWSTGFRPVGVRATPALERALDAHARPGITVVDIGCGDASKTGLWSKSRGVSYVGFDVSQEAVAAATNAGFEARVIGDGSSLPLEDGSVDLAVCTEVLEHLFDPLATVAEAHRVLKPGGVLVVTVPNIAHWRLRLDLLVLGRWNPLGDNLAVQQPWRDPHIRFYTPKVTRNLLRTAGFADVQISGISGNLLARVPGLRSLSKRPGAVTRLAVRLSPSVFGSGICAVATR